MSQKGVRVFDQPSRNDNLIVAIDHKSTKTTADLAQELLGKVVFVGWPHLFEAKVIKVYDETDSFSLWDGIQKTTKAIFAQDKKSIYEHHLMRMGIDVGEVTQIVKVVACTGDEYIYDSQAKSYKHVKTWSRFESSHPMQTVIQDIKAYRQKFKEIFQVTEVYKPGTLVFMKSSPMYYGSSGEVMDTLNFDKTGRIKVNLTVFSEPNFNKARELLENVNAGYMNSYQAACLASISVNAFNRVTGNVPVIPGSKRDVNKNATRINIGLNLKYTKQNEEVIGYTKRFNEKSWLYSEKVVHIIVNYYNRLPKLFQILTELDNNSGGMIFEGDLFDDLSVDNLSEVTKWLKDLPHNNADRRAGGNSLVEKEVVEEVIKACERNKNEPFKKIQLQIKPHLLFLPELHKSSKMPDTEAKFEMFDRVVVAKSHDKFPIGSRGTVIGIYLVKDPNPVRQEQKDKIDRYCEVLFDVEIPDSGMGSLYGLAQNRVGRVLDIYLLNITHGRKSREEADGNTSTVGNKTAGQANKDRNNTSVQPTKTIEGPNSFAKALEGKVTILKKEPDAEISKKLEEVKLSPKIEAAKPENQSNMQEFWQSMKSNNNNQTATMPDKSPNENGPEKFQAFWNNMKNGKAGDTTKPAVSVNFLCLKMLFEIRVVGKHF